MAIDKGKIAALAKAGHLKEAKADCSQLCQENPNDPEALFLLGNIQGQLGEFEQAEVCFRRLVELIPNVPDIHNTLGTICQAQRKMEEAAAHFQQAIKLNPKHTGALYNLATTLQHLGLYEQAVSHFKAVLEIQPSLADAHLHIGAAYQKLLMSDLTLAHYQKVLDVQSNNARAHYNIGTVLQDRGQIDKAIDKYSKAIECDPAFVTAHSQKLLAMNYSSVHTDQEIFAEHKRWAEQYAANRDERGQYHFEDGVPNTRLRIAYVSSDFRAHSVEYYIEPLLAAHNRQRVEVYCYSNVPQPDDTTARLKARADQWRDIHGMSDDEAAQLIYEDRIDIMVDLGGHTVNNRLLLFVRRPAPIQVTYLGYPNTTGLPMMDYRLTDSLCDPEEEGNGLHTETLVRIPGCFLCFGPTDSQPIVNRLPEEKAGYITFGSFNNGAKITSETFALWCRILKEVPGSRLLLKSRQFGDPRLQELFRERATSHGISRERLEIMGSIADRGDHMALYDRVDIALDPFPYNGTTTTCEALWMGVPVITLAGTRHSGRVGTSLLTCVGLHDMVAGTPDEYCNTATALAADAPGRKQLKEELRHAMRRSSLMNRERFAALLEDAYQEMWQQRR